MFDLIVFDNELCYIIQLINQIELKVHIIEGQVLSEFIKVFFLLEKVHPISLKEHLNVFQER